MSRNRGPLRRAEALSSTYRVQLRTPESDPDGEGLRFSDVEELAPYLADLGVGSVYLSPILEAVRGSTHGYDVVDPTRVSEELGGIGGLRALRETCRRHGLGLVVDIVPNHVGVEKADQNPWWWEVLRDGAGSSRSRFFDLDIDPDNGADGKIFLPVLGSPEATAELTVDSTGGPDGEPVLRYYESVFPIAEGTGDGTPVEIHDRQHYRLGYWREPLLGFRRFFTVTGLAGLRQSDRAVFDATHAAVAQWCDEDLVDGIRVDHPDGLAEPVGYARWLRELAGPDRWLLVEKILAPGEVLEPSMPVDGTTGYDMLRLIDQVLVDRRGERVLAELSRQNTGTRGDAADVHAAALQLKRDVLEGDFTPEVARLGRVVRREATEGFAQTLHSDEVPDEDLHEAIREVVAATPFYRADYPVLRGTLPRILEELHRDRPELAGALRLLGRALGHSGESAQRLAQVTGAATAKAEEDRLFYRLARLVSLNEVGGSPAMMGIPVEAFHLAMAEKASDIPLTLNALTTHDTKRGEDVRARIAVLSQVPERWARLCEAVWTDAPPPADDAGYFLLQVVVGVWPADGAVTDDLRDRLRAYAEKAQREAALHTTWTETDADFETALAAWIDALCSGTVAETITEFVATIDGPGKDNALVAKALQLLGPGVPDVYQGTEVWEDSLVDPDNRRFVDYEPLRSGEAADHPKFSLVRAALHVRRDHPEAMARGAHVPLPVSGGHASDVIAFTRDVDGEAAIGLVARRRTAALATDELRGTQVALPEGEWLAGPEAVFAGRVVSGSIDVGELLAEYPVAILRRQ